MFITAVIGVIFSIKLRWSKNRSLTTTRSLLRHGYMSVFKVDAIVVPGSPPLWKVEETLGTKLMSFLVGCDGRRQFLR